MDPQIRADCGDAGLPRAGRLNGRAYVITGATSGMGRATAKLLHAEGARLVLSGRDQERGQTLANELDSQGRTAIFLPGDVARERTNKILVDGARTAFGRLDGFVLNAGMLGLGAVTSIGPKTWQRTLNVNLNAAFHLLHHSLPTIEQSDCGSIVLNASIAATKSFPNHAAYCTSKAALVALGKQVALDYSPKVRVNSICPGPVDTPLIWDSAKAFEDPESAVRAAGEATLVGRLGEPEDFARLALFLLSDEASWITGAAYTLDGGITVR